MQETVIFCPCCRLAYIMYTLSPLGVFSCNSCSRWTVCWFSWSLGFKLKQYIRFFATKGGQPAVCLAVFWITSECQTAAGPTLVRLVWPLRKLSSLFWTLFPYICYKKPPMAGNYSLLKVPAKPALWLSKGFHISFTLVLNDPLPLPLLGKLQCLCQESIFMFVLWGQWIVAAMVAFSTGFGWEPFSCRWQTDKTINTPPLGIANLITSSSTLCSGGSNV